MLRRLRTHQRQNLPYAIEQDHPAIFWEMRLGKTLFAIRRILRYIALHAHLGLRILIVAPNSALGSWEDELVLEEEFDFVYLQGTAKERLVLLKEGHKWNLINKEGFIALPEVAYTYDQSTQDWVDWDVVVADESLFIMNPKAKVTKFFLKNFRGAAHRWVLCGLPNPQSDLQLWCQLAFLDGKAFRSNSYWSFRARFFEQFFYEWEPKVNTATMIKNTLAKRVSILSRADVNLDVEKVYERRMVELPARLVKAYEDLENNFILDYRNFSKDTKYAPVKLQWMRQLCNGFLEKQMVWDGKIQMLLELLTTELANDQVIIWFSFRHEIDAVYQFLRGVNIAVRWVDGRIEPRQRRKMVADFSQGKFRVFLLQIAIAVTGMNLSAADTSIYFGPPFGVNLRSQSEDRILDVMKTGPLLIIDLLVKDTVDTALLTSLQHRAANQKWSLKYVKRLIDKQRSQRAKA